MSLRKSWLVLKICFGLLKFYAAASGEFVDIELYYGGVKTHERQTMDCDLSLHQLYCSFHCLGRKYFCLKDHCYCYEPKESSLQTNSLNYRPRYVLTHTASAETSEDSTSVWEPSKSVETLKHQEHYSEEYSSEENTLEEYQRPALRHHIAHFCANLQIGANCIRKCMRQGKPAFCWKDNVCYCGHKYSIHDKDPPVNKLAQQQEWKDLYKEYYGYTSKKNNKLKAAHKLNKKVDNYDQSDDIIVNPDIVSNENTLHTLKKKRPRSPTSSSQIRIENLQPSDDTDDGNDGVYQFARNNDVNADGTNNFARNSTGKSEGGMKTFPNEPIYFGTG